jgi:hypothetical protein
VYTIYINNIENIELPQEVRTMEEKQTTISAEDKRMIKDVKKCKPDSLLLAMSYMQGLQAAMNVYQQSKVVGQ